MHWPDQQRRLPRRLGRVAHRDLRRGCAVQPRNGLRGLWRTIRLPALASALTSTTLAASALASSVASTTSAALPAATIAASPLPSATLSAAIW